MKKDLKDNKHDSLHLGRKYPGIFVLGHYLFLVAHSFPRATLSENCSILGTDNVRGQISQLIIWQGKHGKSARFYWFFVGQDFAIQAVSMETVIGCEFFVKPAIN